MDVNQAIQLLERFKDGEATPEETAIVQSWINSYVAPKPMASALTDAEFQTVQDEVWMNMGIVHQPRKTFTLYRYVAAAAAIVMIIGFTWQYFQHQHKTDSNPITQVTKDFRPGGNNAILTLANGTVTSLNTQSGAVATNLPAGVLVTNNATSGVVTFKFKPGKLGGANPSVPEDKRLNTITTPRGGQYQLVLPDGTRVFLNAESEIKFPSYFAGEKRLVYITGEAYFQVTKDPNHPFQVNTEDQQLTVLGTHFNVAAYPGEPVKTTLTEGSVLLLQPSTGIRQPLKPDQQAMLLSKNGFDVKTVNPSLELAWIDGMFIFSGTPLKDAMRQISRWYNVEVDYASLPDQQVDGNLYRTLTLNQLLKAIELYGKFELKEGRRLVYIK